MNSKRENGAVLFAICPARSLGLLLSGTLGDRAEKVKPWAKRATANWLLQNGSRFTGSCIPNLDPLPVTLYSLAAPNTL